MDFHAMIPICIVLLQMESPFGEQKSRMPTPCFHAFRFNEDGDTLSAYTIGGHACELELRTGKLISQATIK